MILMMKLYLRIIPRKKLSKLIIIEIEMIKMIEMIEIVKKMKIII
jgi:hypothetical protein